MQNQKQDKWIYLVAGERNIHNGIVKFANVGDAFDVEQRLKDIDYARKAAGGKWIKLASWNIGNRRDYDLHRILRKKGFIFDPSGTKNTEEIQFNLPLKEAISVVSSCVNELLNGIVRPNNFGPREEQQNCINQIVDWFSNENSDQRFLINAKMRFGKTVTSYWAMKALASKKTLILTYKPAVEDSWRNDLDDHIDFADYSFKNVQNGYTGDGVYFASMQGVLADEKSAVKKRSWIYDSEWDLIIIDEEHYGTRSENAVNVFSSFTNVKRWIFLSGTPYKALLGNEFCNEQIFTWSYEDEQFAKQKNQHLGNKSPYVMLPKLSFLTYEFSDLIKESNKKLYSNDEQFTISKLFMVNDSGSFENPGAVNEFLNLIGGLSLNSKPKNSSPWHSNVCAQHPEQLNHTLWVMPQSVSSCYAMSEMLKKNSFFSDFKILIVAGGEDITELDKLKKEISRNEKTITLTVGRFTTGVTVPEWGAVFFLDDGKSPTSYYQAAFRCQSPQALEKNRITQKVTRWKSDCFVVDFNPHRLLEMTYELALIKSQQKQNSQKNITEILQEMLDCAPIYRHSYTSLCEIPVNEIINISITEKNFIDKFANANAVDVTKVSEEIIHTLLDVESDVDNKLVKQITNAGIERGKNSKKSISNNQAFDNTENDELSNKKLNEIKEKAITVLKKIPSFLFQLDEDIVSFECIEKKNLKQSFYETLSLTFEDFSDMLNAGFISRDHLNSCILAFAVLKQEIRMLPFSKEKFERIANLASKLYLNGQNTITPVHLVEEMLDSLPSELWESKDKTFFDPACGIGTFYFLMMFRLFEGLLEQIEDEDERIKHILQNQLSANDIDPLQLKRFNSCVELLGLKHVKKNVYNSDILELGTSMKFDVIATNPPYNSTDENQKENRSCYVEFVNVFVKMSEQVLVITPGNWLQGNGNKKVKDYCYNVLNHYGLKSITYFEKDAAAEKFNWPKVFGGIVYYTLEKNYDGIVKFENKTNNISYKTTSLKELGFIPTHNENIELTMSILSKVNHYEKMNKLCSRGPYGSRKVSNLLKKQKEGNYEGTYKCYMSRGRHVLINENDIVSKDMDSYKLAINYACGPNIKNNTYFLNKDETCSESFMYFCTSNENEMKNILSYISCEFVVFLRSVVFSSHNNTSKTWRFVPIVDFSQEWNNEKVYNFFGLTQEEIEHCKKVYAKHKV